MCGIVGGIGEPSDEALAALAHRGPDAHAIVRVGDFWFGHARLAIQDPNPRSDQPFRKGDVTLVYNGELWNHVELRKMLQGLGERFETTGDTEVFAAMVHRFPIECALERMEGMFAAAWTHDGKTLHIARDRHGEVPLHISVGSRFTFASELKALRAMDLNPKGYQWVEPGERLEVTTRGFRRAVWYEVPELKRHELPTTFDGAKARVRGGVEQGSVERTVSDVPVCTLLSGGIDSAVVAANAKAALPELVAYIAVMDTRSADLRAAREVAEHLNMPLIEVPVRAPTATDLASVIEAIEMPHKAQVEIGWACMKLAERMRSDGFKVTLSGEGSDELWASYGFAYHGLQQHGWTGYRRRLFREQHRKNFARCNKIFMAHGVECRLPFLSTGLVELALSLPQDMVAIGKGRPKAVLQDGHADLLPERVITRQKLAFQDGLGIKGACVEAVSKPRAYYTTVFDHRFGCDP